MDEQKEPLDLKERNKILCEKYPFLIPGKCVLGSDIEWDCTYTELDAMPDGWRKAFGEQLCDELKTELEQAGVLNDYRILQIKEKYGELRWYDHGNTEDGRQILRKYAELSSRTCIGCGKPATRITTGYILPVCDDCCPHIQSVPIEEFFSPVPPPDEYTLDFTGEGGG